MPYTETVTRDGRTVTGPLSDAGAVTLVHRGRGLGAAVSAAENGTVTLTRTTLHPGMTDGEVGERTTVTTLSPTVRQRRLSPRQYEDLQRVHRRGSIPVREDGSVFIPFYRIPPSAVRRLLDRGLLVISPANDSVALGIAGLLAMTTYEHQVKVSTRSTFDAHCSCGELGHSGVDLASALDATRLHLEQHLTAALTA